MPTDRHYVHESAIVDETARVGRGTRIWHFCHVMDGAILGSDCSLGQGVFVGRGVAIGSGCKLQNNVSVYEGVELADEVFVGPSAVFTNVNNPRAAVSRKHAYRRTVVERGATIGANATILPGVTLGAYCFVGAGATVTRDVPAYALVVGVPARSIGWMSRSGERLDFAESSIALCPATGERYLIQNGSATLVEG